MTQDAAEFYEKAGNLEKAAKIYIQVHNFDAAKKLLGKISIPKLHSEYAEAREANGQFEEAVSAYINAQDIDNATRVYLEKLNQPQKASKLVLNTRSAGGADLVAKVRMLSKPQIVRRSVHKISWSV